MTLSKLNLATLENPKVCIGLPIIFTEKSGVSAAISGLSDKSIAQSRRHKFLTDRQWFAVLDENQYEIGIVTAPSEGIVAGEKYAIFVKTESEAAVTFIAGDPLKNVKTKRYFSFDGKHSPLHIKKIQTTGSGVEAVKKMAKAVVGRIRDRK